MKHRIRSKAVALTAGLLVAGSVGAAAASLGGISTTGLGSDADFVSSCDTDGVTVQYTTSYAAGAVLVDQATIGSVAEACHGLGYEVGLYDSSDATLGEVTGTVALSKTAFVVDFSSVDVDAARVAVIAVSISGN